MADTAITLSEAKAQLTRLRSSMANLREKTKKGAESAMGTVETAAGGACFALVEKYGPANVIDDVDNAGLVGAGLAFAGSLDLFGEISPHVTNVGRGMLAVSSYKLATKALT